MSDVDEVNVEPPYIEYVNVGHMSNVPDVEMKNRFRLPLGRGVLNILVGPSGGGKSVILYSPFGTNTVMKDYLSIEGYSKPDTWIDYVDPNGIITPLLPGAPAVENKGSHIERRLPNGVSFSLYSSSDDLQRGQSYSYSMRSFASTLTDLNLVGTSKFGLIRDNQVLTYWHPSAGEGIRLRLDAGKDSCKYIFLDSVLDGLDLSNQLRVIEYLQDQLAIQGYYHTVTLSTCRLDTLNTVWDHWNNEGNVYYACRGQVPKKIDLNLFPQRFQMKMLFCGDRFQIVPYINLEESGSFLEFFDEWSALDTYIPAMSKKEVDKLLKIAEYLGFVVENPGEEGENIKCRLRPHN